MARERHQVKNYETHRGFKALAFYLLARSLTTSNGVYKQHDQSFSHFNKTIGRQMGYSFNTIKKMAEWAQNFGFIKITDTGYQFVSVDKIVTRYGIYYPQGEITYQTITITENESLEHILKTLVFGENFAKQEYAVLQKIKRIPGIDQKLSQYITGWQSMPLKKLLQQIVLWQKQTFLNYTKGTEAYDLFHSIHADIALTCRRIKDHFNFKCSRSAVYVKKVLASLQYITVTNRALIGNATRKPHDLDGSVKPITFIYMPRQKARKWLMPDLITLNLKNLTNWGIFYIFHHFQQLQYTPSVYWILKFSVFTVSTVIMVLL